MCIILSIKQRDLLLYKNKQMENRGTVTSTIGAEWLTHTTIKQRLTATKVQVYSIGSSNIN